VTCYRACRVLILDPWFVLPSAKFLLPNYVSAALGSATWVNKVLHIRSMTNQENRFEGRAQPRQRVLCGGYVGFGWSHSLAGFRAELCGATHTRGGGFVALVAGGAKLGLVTKTLFWNRDDGRLDEHLPTPRFFPARDNCRRRSAVQL
jgi:hypothetical protein